MHIFVLISLLATVPKVPQQLKMVITALMWKSLDRFTRYFGIFWKNPLEWYPKTKMLIFTPVSRKIIPYMISVYGFLNILNITLFLILISELFGISRLGFINLLVIFCWAGMVFYALALETLIVFAGKNFTYAMNCTSALAKILCT